MKRVFEQDGDSMTEIDEKEKKPGASLGVSNDFEEKHSWTCGDYPEPLVSSARTPVICMKVCNRK